MKVRKESKFAELLEQSEKYRQLCAMIAQALKDKEPFGWGVMDSTPGGKVYKGRLRSYQLMVAVPDEGREGAPMGTAIDLTNGQLFIVRGEHAVLLGQAAAQALAEPPPAASPS